MLILRIIALSLLMMCLLSTASANTLTPLTPLPPATKTVVLTIDDLPFVGLTDNKPGNLRRANERFMRILKTLEDEKVPATGFVIAGSIAKGQWQLLEAFLQQGLILGNHTYSHLNLGQTSAEKYIENIDKADKKLAPLMSTPKYFRYPYLSEGQGEKKQAVLDYLKAHGYVVAPVTVDSKDYEFNEQYLRINWRTRAGHLSSIKNQYFNYVWRQTEKAEKNLQSNSHPLILLVHANVLNSLCLEDLIKLYKTHGYRFIPLSDAVGQSVM